MYASRKIKVVSKSALQQFKAQVMKQVLTNLKLFKN